MIFIKTLKILPLIFLFNFIIIKYKCKEYLKFKLEIKKIVKYFKINDKGILINKKKFYKNMNPKISIISAVFNREKFILRFLRSVQNQYLENIEIIFIDDCSKDRSVNIIEKYKTIDERIILLKQKKNKGTLISRNIGSLKSKGEYLIFPDPDDIISLDILEICYEMAKKNNFEMIRFNMYTKKFFPFSLIPNSLENIIYQPELRTHLIYGLGYPKLIDGVINNKFIKRTAFIKTLNDISIYYQNKNMIYFEDGLINFALHFNIKSLYLLKNIGYYYIFNKESVSHSLKINTYLKCLFIYLKFVLENIKNNIFEKSMILFLLDEYIKNNNLLNDKREILGINKKYDN